MLFLFFLLIILLCILAYFSFHLPTILSLLIHLCICIFICHLFICLFIYCHFYVFIYYLLDIRLSLTVCCKSSNDLSPSCLSLHSVIRIMIQNRIARATSVLGTKLCLVVVRSRSFVESLWSCDKQHVSCYGVLFNSRRLNRSSLFF